MTNSDTAYGVHNKKTQILSQEDNGTDALTNHADVAAAKSFFYTDEALAVLDECCTQLQWSLVNDDKGNPTKVKYTMAFGTKGGNIAEADDWAGQYNSRKDALISSEGWAKNHYLTEEVDSHLF